MPRRDVATRAPITFTANIGDQLRFVVNDTTLPLSGKCPGLSTLYLVDPQGQSGVATPGFYIGCPDVPEGTTAPGPGQGLVFDATFTIPDFAVSGSLYKEVALPGSAFAGPLLLNGALYGVTYDGGNGGGTIFRAAPDLSQVTTLYSFPGTGQTGQIGVPYAELTPGGKGFFGTTYLSVNGGGTIFEFDISTNTITYLVEFSDFANGARHPVVAHRRLSLRVQREHVRLVDLSRPHRRHRLPDRARVQWRRRLAPGRSHARP